MAEAARDNYVFDSSNLTYGACLYRTGRLDDAVAALSAFTEAIDRGGDVYDQYHLACAKYFLALARHDLGHDFQAHRHLREANRLTEGLSDRLSQPWRRHIELDVLRQEATDGHWRLGGPPRASVAAGNDRSLSKRCAARPRPGSRSDRRLNREAAYAAHPASQICWVAAIG
jgi:hypothetical protein